MKKILIYFICGLFMSLSATAQNSVTAQRPNWMRHAEKTIIKNHIWGGTATVTCSNVEDGVTFIYSTSAMQTMEITVEGLWVNDMVIENDSLYFCGKTKGTGRGAMGFVYIRQFNVDSMTVTAWVDTNLYVGETEIEVGELTRIAFYADPIGDRHVYCVGTCSDVNHPCLINWVVNHSLYWAGYVNNPKESFTDVKVVRMYPDGYTSYLATVGFDKTENQYINIRIYDMSFVFMPSGPQEWCHVYKVDPDYVRPWRDSVALLARIDNNAFATVSYREGAANGLRDTLLPATGSNIHLGFYDLNLIIANSVYGLVDNYEIPMGLIYRHKMKQFVYSGRKDAFVFLHNYTKVFSSVNSEYCEVPRASLSTSGTFQAYKNKDTRQYGLDLYMHKTKYILSGFDETNQMTLKFQMNTFGVLADCADPLSYKYNQTKTIASHNFQREFLYGKRSFRPEELEREIEMLPIFIDCEK